MAMNLTDIELLERFRRHRCQESFNEMVRRYLPLVHSAALRQLRSPELAEEVSQEVFVALANQANGLRPNTVLGAWLYQVTRRSSIDRIRQEKRRTLREAQAFQSLEGMNEESSWDHVAPLIDAAIAELGEADRVAILLRYFQDLPFRKIAELLETTEDAAQKRVTRATDKLRQILARQGARVASASLVLMLSTQGIQAASPSLIALVSAAGSSVPSAPLSLSAATSHLLTLSAMKKSIVILCLALGITVATTAVILHGNEKAHHWVMHFIGSRVYRTKPNDSDRDRAELNRSLSDASQLLVGLLIHAQSHEGQLATRLDELSVLLGGPESQLLPRLARFEILRPSRRAFAGSDLLLRELRPRSRSGGGTARIYGFGDGHVENVPEPAEGYEEWERAQANKPAVVR